VLEPQATALQLALLGLLLVASILLSRAPGRLGLPVAFVFLAIGLLAGAFVTTEMADYATAFRVGSAALALILFDGGLNTPRAAIRAAIAPASVLATLGSAITASIIAVGAHLWLHMGWLEAALLGAVVCSTDAAAVFSVLRGSGVHLRKRVGATLEVESGVNDPTAVILTVMLTGALVEGGMNWTKLLTIPLEFAVGGALGVGIGLGARLLLRWARLPAGGLYPVLTLAVAFLGFGLPTLAHGSGFLAVYTAGVVIGDGKLPYRHGLLRVHDALAWLGQIIMFLILGLLVTPAKLLEVAVPGLVIGTLLAFVARPIAVALCLAPFRFNRKEIAYIGWVGLRGAVPIILATYPVLAGAPGAERIFHLVFFVVAVNAIIPGATVGRVTRWLKLGVNHPPPPHAVLEINSTLLLEGDILSFHVSAASAVSGASIADLSFPAGSSVMLVVRGTELLAARGQTLLLVGDHVYVFCRPEDRGFMTLLFGQQEE
jgi:potassium/hydrogen antiporter